MLLKRREEAIEKTSVDTSLRHISKVIKVLAKLKKKWKGAGRRRSVAHVNVFL